MESFLLNHVVGYVVYIIATLVTSAAVDDPDPLAQVPAPVEERIIVRIEHRVPAPPEEIVVTHAE